MVVFDAVSLGLADIIREGVELAFHDGMMPVQDIRQRRHRRIARIVPRHWREFVAQRQPQLEFQVIAHEFCRLAPANVASPVCAWRYFGAAFGGLPETAGVGGFGAGVSVALSAPSQLQASARRERISEILPRLNNASFGAP